MRKAFKEGKPMRRWWPRSYRQELFDKIEAIASAQRSLRNLVEELVEKFEEKEEENTGQVSELRDSLKSKTAFIEGLFSTMLEKTLANGHAPTANGVVKSGPDMVDISKLSTFNKDFVHKKIKEANSAK